MGRRMQFHNSVISIRTYWPYSESVLAGEIIRSLAFPSTFSEEVAFGTVAREGKLAKSSLPLKVEQGNGVNPDLLARRK